MSPSARQPENHSRPMTPPLSAIPETGPLRMDTNTPLPSASSKGVKRKSSHEAILLSQPLASATKKPKIVRSSSQPPLRNRMARSRDTETPEFDEDGMPIRYTPTTGRISKAKKGLPVHYCQYGCGKVYTRAEHRKRHEQNHRKDALFRCTVPDCQKEFQRFDLFQRHLERQCVDEEDWPTPTLTSQRRHGQGLGLNDRHRASSVESSVASSSALDMSDAMVVPALATSVPMGVTTPPYTSTFPAYAMDMENPSASLTWTGAEQQIPTPLASAAAPEGYPGMYAEPLRQPGQLHQLQGTPRSRTMSAPPTGSQEQFIASQAQNPSAPNTGVWPPAAYWQQQQQQQPTPITSSAASFQDSYGVDEPRGREHISRVDNVSRGSTDSRIGLPAIPDDDGEPDLVADPDAEHLQHYTQCYWDSFDALFPVVHKPSYSPASTESVLLGCMMVAVGAQFSPRALAAAHSLKSYKVACSMVDQGAVHQDFASESLACMQGIFMWEYFSLYKRRSPGVHRSQNFVRLYDLLLKSELASDETVAGQPEQYEEWIHNETKRRLLTACFILDTYRSTLFHQASTRVLPPDAVLPGPCPTDLWTAPSASEWQALSGLGEISPSVTPFKSAFENALGLHLEGRLNLGNPATVPLSAWALQLATQAPIRSLAILANDNAQHLQQPIRPEEWADAKRKATQWATGPAASVDTFYAGRVLNAYFTVRQRLQSGGDDDCKVGLEAEWCLYIATIVLWAFTTLSSTGSQAQPAQMLVQQSGRAPNSPPVLSYQPTGLMSPSSLIGSPQSVLGGFGAPQPFLPSQPLQAPDPTVRSSSRARFGAQNALDAFQEPAVQHILQALNAPDPTSLSQMQGRRGTGPLMSAVRDVLSYNLQTKSLAIVEATEVLNNLIESEEIRSLMMAV